MRTAFSWALPLFAALASGCSQSLPPAPPTGAWQKHGRLLEIYGKGFLHQSAFLDVAPWPHHTYSYLVPNPHSTAYRIIININFKESVYQVDGGSWKRLGTGARLEKRFGIHMTTFRYWKEALDDLQTATISKHELSCRCVYISDQQEARYGKLAVGWFYIPHHDRDSGLSLRDLTHAVKMDKGWYWGIYDEEEPNQG